MSKVEQYLNKNYNRKNYVISFINTKDINNVDIYRKENKDD